MNQLFIDKLHEAKTDKNAKLLEAVEQMYIVCEQKAELEGVMDSAKKFGKAALVAGAVLGGSHLADQALKAGMEKKAEDFKKHELSCGGMFDEKELDRPLNYDINDPAAYGVFDAVQNMVVSLNKTNTDGGYKLADEIYQLYKEVEEGAPESVHHELMAKMMQGKKFMAAVNTGRCEDGLPS